MPDRLPINSESLKARFPEVYRDLFENYPIVTSCAVHIDFTRTWIGRQFIAPAVWQKLPARLYIGFAPGGDRFEIREVFFHASENRFIEENVQELDWKHFAITYPAWAKKRGHPIQGGKILYLSEKGHARGLGASKTIHFAALPYILKNDVLVETLRDDILKQPLDQLLNNVAFQTLLQDVWELTLLLSRRGSSANALNLASLVDSEYPIITFSPSVSDPKDIAGTPLVWFRIQDIIKPVPHGMAFDAALIYPRATRLRHTLVARYREDIKKRYTENVQQLESLLRQFPQLSKLSKIDT